MDMTKINSVIINDYLPGYIRTHMKTLGLTREETEKKVKEIMGDPIKKQEYMKLIEELAKEEDK